MNNQFSFHALAIAHHSAYGSLGYNHFDIMIN